MCTLHCAAFHHDLFSFLAVAFSAWLANALVNGLASEHAQPVDDVRLERIRLIATEERVGAQAAAWRKAAATAASESAAAGPAGAALQPAATAAAAAAAAAAALAMRQEEEADRQAAWQALLDGLLARAQPLMRAAGDAAHLLFARGR